MEGKSSSLFIKIVIAGLAAGIFIKLFAFDILHVSGSSMSPAINDGDVVFVNKLSYGLAIPFRGTFIFQWAEPKAGDVVIYLHDNKTVVKRVAATGGTHLDFSEDSDYNLILGGNKICLSRDQFLKMSQYDSVPQGYVLALGDNYSESVDSRSYGFVSVKNVTGKIIGK